MCENVAKPFLKWAGGKGQLLNKFEGLYPLQLKQGNIEIYIEPFIGGGAVFFDVIQKYNIKKAVIIDINKELINCYRCIKADSAQVIRKLSELQNQYLILDEKMRAELYYNARKEYNEIHLNGKYDFKKAADFIFLNKTCYNGLYRVNSKGEFNVPHGRYKSPMICDSKNITLVGKLLQNVDIIYGDYTECEKYLIKDTFVYFDPPYRPLAEFGSFVNYSKNGFDDEEQIKLADFYKKVNKTGSLLMLSNSDPKNINSNDNFFDELYKDFNLQRISAKRMINCQAEKRGNVTEIVITNYKGENK
ncbi:MAG: DNA adenine methylase [Clostridia bacterium]|jgi:DNA adenine methylase